MQTTKTSSRGNRMKVVSGTNQGPLAVPGADVGTGASVAPQAAPAAEAPLDSTILQPALEAASQSPGIDQAKVAELRDALASGALPFDPAKLAALVEQYHRGSK